MNELHLFAGAGGGILGGLLLGHVPVCAVELEEYPRKVLLQRQRDGILPWFPIWDDVRTFDGNPWRGKVDVVCGGFPCQDISVAGKGAGITGERSGLWKEFARIIGEVRPRFVFVENSPALASRGLGTVLGDLSSMGFHAEWGVLGAHHVGAPHKRDRIWILAYAMPSGERREQWESEAQGDALAHTLRYGTGEGLGELSEQAVPSEGPERRRPRAQPRHGRENLADTEILGRGPHRDRTETGMESGSHIEPSPGFGSTLPHSDCSGREEQRSTVADGTSHETFECRGWWESEPGLGRVAHGVGHRVDRLKAIGNGQVPAVASLAWRILKGS